MRKTPAVLVSTARRLVLLAAWLSAASTGLAAGTNTQPASAPFDYASPALVTGTLYAIGSDRKQILYTFRRTATRSGTTINVSRQFFTTNGVVAAEENIEYDSGQLVAYTMREFQAKVSGAIRIVADPKRPDRRKLVIGYGRRLEPPPGAAQTLPPDTEIDDTLYPFMLTHWAELMRGDAVKFHFVSLEWKRTFEFRLVRTGESMHNGRAVEQLQMTPISRFVSHFVKPLVFWVEKDSPHHLLSYIGRTTPRVQKGKSWKYLDAETVFDWGRARTEVPATNRLTSRQRLK